MAKDIHHEAGFSLLEVIVSLVILGLASSVVVINMLPMLDDRRQRAAEGQLVAAIEQARLQTFALEQPIALKAFLAENHPQLAQQVTVDENLLILPAGACQTGEIQLQTATARQTFYLGRLTCELTPAVS